MRVLHTICCGIDVHKKSVTACLMWGPADQEPQFEIRRFGTMTWELKSLAEWLKQAQCEVAAMESTELIGNPYGTCWKAHNLGFEVDLKTKTAKPQFCFRNRNEI